MPNQLIHSTEGDQPMRIIRADDKLIIEALSTDALGNEIWVAVSRPYNSRHAAAWDFLKETILTLHDTISSLQ